MAARRARAAGRADAAHRGIADCRRGTSYQARMAAFLNRLQQLGWTEGHNLRIDYRRSGSKSEDILRDASELVALTPDVILTSGGTGLAQLLRATRIVPIVFMSAVDPVGSAFVESLARPGGNATGFMQFEYNLSGKWLELLKQIAPSVTRAAVLRDAATTSGVGQFAVIQSVAPSVGVDGRSNQRGRCRRRRARHRGFCANLRLAV